MQQKINMSYNNIVTTWNVSRYSDGCIEVKRECS